LFALKIFDVIVDYIMIMTVIEVEVGEKVLYDYVNTGKNVYQPER
jgi:hypothetical protein